jgi:hypothetical protein
MITLGTAPTPSRWSDVPSKDDEHLEEWKTAIEERPTGRTRED